MSHGKFVLAAVLLASALGGGCAADDRGSDDPATDAAASSSSAASEGTATATSETSPTETSSSTAAADEEGANCLLTIPQVSRVLGGAWERKVDGDGPCAYTSDRGASFTTTAIERPVERGLAWVRRQCVKGIEPIQVGDGFVCFEQKPEGDFVLGSTGVDGQLWILVIAPISKGVPAAELQAMMGLVGAAQRG